VVLPALYMRFAGRTHPSHKHDEAPLVRAAE
jgi:hypothetical protein